MLKYAGNKLAYLVQGDAKTGRRAEWKYAKDLRGYEKEIQDYKNEKKARVKEAEEDQRL